MSERMRVNQGHSALLAANRRSLIGEPEASG